MLHRFIICLFILIILVKLETNPIKEYFTILNRVFFCIKMLCCYFTQLLNKIIWSISWIKKIATTLISPSTLIDLNISVIRITSRFSKGTLIEDIYSFGWNVINFFRKYKGKYISIFLDYDRNLKNIVN